MLLFGRSQLRPPSSNWGCGPLVTLETVAGVHLYKSTLECVWHRDGRCRDRRSIAMIWTFHRSRPATTVCARTHCAYSMTIELAWSPIFCEIHKTHRTNWVFTNTTSYVKQFICWFSYFFFLCSYHLACVLCVCCLSRAALFRKSFPLYIFLFACSFAWLEYWITVTRNRPKTHTNTRYGTNTGDRMISEKCIALDFNFVVVCFLPSGAGDWHQNKAVH